MKIYSIRLLAAFFFFISGTCFADQGFHGAIGISGLVTPYTDSSFQQLSPELVAYGYHSLSDSFILRPGIRFNSAWQQPERNETIQIRETDWKLSAETGVIYQWIVLPSLSVGAGLLLRNTSLYTDSSIQVESTAVPGNTLYPFIYGQLGVGIPMAKGMVMIEPYLRFVNIFGDTRISWAYGLEATIAVF